jgi:hypothetical protein
LGVIIKDGVLYGNQLDSYTKTETNALLNTKQGTLTFDNTPTASSQNPVTSGGVKAANDALANSIDATIEQHIPSHVADWLDEHVDPATGYVVDDTLSIGGAAADAAICGDLKSAIYNDNAVELLRTFIPETNSPNIWTWDRNSGTCVVNGTAGQNGAFLTFYSNKTSMPVGIKAGQKVIVQYKTSNSLIKLSIIGYVSGQSSAASTKEFIESGEYIIPENTVGLIIRLYVNAGVQITNGTVSVCKLFTTYSNKKLGDDINNVMQYSAYDIVSRGLHISNTSNGASFTWNEEGTECTVNTPNGPTSGLAFGYPIYNNKQKLPDGVKPNSDLVVTYETSDQNVKLQCLTYIEGQSGSHRNIKLTENGVIHIDSNEVGILIRLIVESGASVNNTVISSWHILTAPTNFDLKNSIVTLSNAVNNAIEPLQKVNSENKIIQYTHNSETRNGITYTWSDRNTCDVDGQATSPFSFNSLYYNQEHLPDWMEAGKKYYVEFETTNLGIYLQFSHYIAGQSGIVTSKNFNTSGVYTVPNDAVGMNIRLYVPVTGIELEHETISKCAVMLEKSNKMLTEDIESKEALPQIYRDEVDRLMGVLQGENANLRFAVYSDPHNTLENNWKKYELLNQQGIFDGLIGLGDFGVYTLNRVPSEVYNDIRKNFNKITRLQNVFFINGNHDAVPYHTNGGKIKDNTTEAHDYMTKLQLRDLYEKHLRGQIMKNEDDPYNPYYYVDFENAKVRMIVLNSSDIFNDDGTYTERFSHSVMFQSRQLNWFANVAMDFSEKGAPGDWSVIVFQHAEINYIYNETSEWNLTAWLLSRAAKGENVDQTFNIKRLLTYNSETMEWNEPSVVKQVHVTANFSQYGQPHIIGLFFGHNHFDTNKYFKYDSETKKFPMVYFGADNTNIYKPYQYFPENQELNTGWYQFTSASSDPITHQPVTVYFKITTPSTDAFRLMYNDALYANGNTPSISVFNENGEFVKMIEARRSIDAGENATEIAFTAGRSRPIDIENCSVVSIDKENKNIIIEAYGFGNETILEYS